MIFVTSLDTTLQRAIGRNCTMVSGLSCLGISEIRDSFMFSGKHYSSKALLIKVTTSSLIILQCL